MPYSYRIHAFRGYNSVYRLKKIVLFCMTKCLYVCRYVKIFLYSADYLYLKDYGSWIFCIKYLLKSTIILIQPSIENGYAAKWGLSFWLHSFDRIKVNSNSYEVGTYSVCLLLGSKTRTKHTEVLTTSVWDSKHRRRQYTFVVFFLYPNLHPFLYLIIIKIPK